VAAHRAEEPVRIVCPRCGSPDARVWHGRTACRECGLFWAQLAEPPLGPRERYLVRRAMDERSDP